MANVSCMVLALLQNAIFFSGLVIVSLSFINDVE
jgi:hypothetical protein